MSQHIALWRLGVLAVALGCGWVLYDWFYGLVVLEAKVIAVMRDPAKPDRRVIHFTVKSDFSEYPFVSPQVRQFFRVQPVVCFLTENGAELMNDDTQNVCLLEETEFEKKGKSHRLETSEFAIPIYLQPGYPGQSRVFLESLRKHKGVWLRFALGGHLFPPETSAQPVFLNLAAYCGTHVAACQGLLGE